MFEKFKNRRAEKDLQKILDKLDNLPKMERNHRLLKAKWEALREQNDKLYEIIEKLQHIYDLIDELTNEEDYMPIIYTNREVFNYEEDE